MGQFKDEDIDGLIITMRDIRNAGHCPAGVKMWFERRGFDVRKAFKEGVPARVLLETGDAHAVQVIEHTLKLRSEAHG